MTLAVAVLLVLAMAVFVGYDSGCASVWGFCGVPCGFGVHECECGAVAVTSGFVHSLRR